MTPGPASACESRQIPRLLNLICHKARRSRIRPRATGTLGRGPSPALVLSRDRTGAGVGLRGALNPLEKMAI